MVRKIALIFGIVYVLIGVLGFVPALTTTDKNGMDLLLGIFMVGAVHNIIHLAVGAVAIAMSKTFASARLFFKGIGLVYGLIAIVGFVQGNTVLGIIDVNAADNFLHLASSLAALYLGFGPFKDDVVTTERV